MPISVLDLIKTVEIDAINLKTAQWNNLINCAENGVYFISTSNDPCNNSPLYDNAPINDNSIIYWLNKTPKFSLDGIIKPTIEMIKNRLNNFWLPDESILYIGQTMCKGGLQKRINQYYKTDLGERKPHAGGHWIKTLEILNKLYIHYIPVKNPYEIEKALLINFAVQVSSKTRNKLYDPNLILPYANLELDKANRKKHGITNSKI